MSQRPRKRVNRDTTSDDEEPQQKRGCSPTKLMAFTEPRCDQKEYFSSINNNSFGSEQINAAWRACFAKMAADAEELLELERVD